MGRPKLTMTKADVQLAIAEYIRKNYANLKVVSREKPDSVHTVLATIQDREYMGAAKYRVLIDVRGVGKGRYGIIDENAHYTASCMVKVSSTAEGSPVISIEDDVIFTKQIN